MAKASVVLLFILVHLPVYPADQTKSEYLCEQSQWTPNADEAARVAKKHLRLSAVLNKTVAQNDQSIKLTLQKSRGDNGLMIRIDMTGLLASAYSPLIKPAKLCASGQQIWVTFDAGVQFGGRLVYKLKSVGQDALLISGSGLATGGAVFYGTNTAER